MQYSSLLPHYFWGSSKIIVSPHSPHSHVKKPDSLLRQVEKAPGTAETCVQTVLHIEFPKMDTWEAARLE